MPDDQGDAGFTLMEMMVAVLISTVLLGAVFTVQKTATDSFRGSLAEHKVTREAREGIDFVKRELRSCLGSSITANAWQNDGLTPLISFKQAVSFDSNNGLTRWGADAEVGGTVEYLVVGRELIRRVRSAAGAIVSERVLIRDIDLDPAGGLDPVTIEWDDDTQLIRLVIHRESRVNGRAMVRDLSTMIHVDPVFEF